MASRNYLNKNQAPAAAKSEVKASQIKPIVPQSITQGIKAPASATLSYAKPTVSTYSPRTGYTAPVGNSPYSGGVGSWNAAPSGGGFSGGAGAASFAPSAPIKPLIDYNSEEYLNGTKDGELDSTFHNQKTLYSEKLKKYIADYDAQTGGKAWGKDLAGFDLDNDLQGSMGVDYRNARDGIARNKDMGLKSVAEDFAARGMVNSGLYAKDWQDSSNQYDRQKTNLGQGTRNQLQTLNFNRGNVEADNTAQIAAARRDALNRLSQAQSLI